MEHGITPASVRRALEDLLGGPIGADYSTVPVEEADAEPLLADPDALAAELSRLEQEMLEAAERLEFEVAAARRDRIRYLKREAVLRA